MYLGIKKFLGVSPKRQNWIESKPAAFSFSLFDYDIIIQYIFIKINWCRGELNLEARNLTRKFFSFLLEFLLFFNIITYFL